MKFYYFDRREQVKHFNDLSIVENKPECNDISCTMLSNEVLVLQVVALSETDDIITDINYTGKLDAYCINRDKTDKFGNKTKSEIAIKSLVLQPLFFIIKSNNQANSQSLVITIKTKKCEYKLSFDILVKNELITNQGYDDLSSLARLNWLNSDRFIDDQIGKPFVSPKLKGKSISLLGREITFNDLGLPLQYSSYFDESIAISKENTNFLFKPFELNLGERILQSNLEFIPHNSSVEILCKGETQNLNFEINGKLHYEGFINYNIKCIAKNDITLDNFSLNSYILPEQAKFINGLGEYGGAYKDINFKYTDEKHLDSLFIGNVNIGMRIKFKAENYIKPLINIYYFNQPLTVPVTTWDNHGLGGIKVDKCDDYCQINAYCGKVTMKKGECKNYNFELHFTPFKPIDFAKHYGVRYSHNNNLKDEIKEVDRAVKNNLNNVVIHHGNMVHPFINYPFIEFERLCKLVEYAKTKGVGVKVYYTVREHSNHMAEVWAYKSLGNEIIMRKKGEGYSWIEGVSKWLTEYFGDEIIPAWRVRYKKGKYKGDDDVSFIVNPNSRLDNYYIEGLDYLVKNAGIKGIYIDDTALDRTTMERARKVLDQINGLIDMHMWNHEEKRAGDVSCMNLYTEIFPFIDSLWIGEGYKYTKLSPDYLLTEVSGIPYGLSSQMLEDGGNPFLGMLYAMNNRYGWGYYSAVNIYKLWDEFGIQESKMYGYWHSKAPIKTTEKDVLCTTYVKDDKALVCLFNFSDKKTNFDIIIDEDLLGFKVNNIERTKIRRIQSRKLVKNNLKLGKKRGVILIVSK